MPKTMRNEPMHVHDGPGSTGKSRRTKGTAAALRRDIEAALCQIANNRALHWINAAEYRQLGVIEGIAHELTHQIDLGRNFEDQLNEMPCCQANDHEAATLRIEVAALAQLGISLSMHRLWRTANWCKDSPTLASVRIPLSRHERDCVHRFVTVVKHTLDDVVLGR